MEKQIVKMLKILGVLMLIGMVASVMLGGRNSSTQNNETITTPTVTAENTKLEADRKRDIENGKRFKTSVIEIEQGKAPTLETR